MLKLIILVIKSDCVIHRKNISYKDRSNSYIETHILSNTMINNNFSNGIYICQKILLKFATTNFTC